MRKPSSAIWSTRMTVPGREGEGEDRPGGEGQRAHRRTGIQLAESGEDQREESGGER